MDEKNYQIAEQTDSGKNKFWRNFGIISLSVFLAVITIIVINL